MNKFFSKSILDELYEANSENFVDSIGKEMQEKQKSFLLEEELTTMLKKISIDEKVQNTLLKKLNEYEMEVAREEDYWYRMFYKLGFYNSTELKRILNDKFKDINNIEEIVTFIDNSTCEFIDGLERHKGETLKSNAQYKKIIKEIEKVKKENPNIRLFLEDNEVVPLTYTEQNELLNVIELEDDLQIIELKESFKLGIKETIKFLIQMNML